MENHYKLILIVLTFFLALTFVQQTHALEAKEIVFNGSSPATVVLTSTNPLPSRAVPEVSLYGPFTTESITGNELTNSNAVASLAATLKPIAGLRTNDVYTGKAIIRWGTQTQEVPLRIRVSDGIGISPASGFSIFFGLGQNLAIIANLILVVVIIMLILGLAIRIRKRLEGN
ncbi:MAG: hypothetical protein IPJ89_04485 [Candidatus Iainarchaeum archaeon]|uniref:Uncharacterized protein n=1 Tax=Candidatus Iainarchaeum sp. TaxID=3101447 RepID=A0A7T9DJC6_9ARCH|nr:MAG: hypothetical protein IPJ89_04485 [Candidatus Diapherotrites archaeon]